MKIVVCPDSFKGSLSAQKVTQVISETLKEEFQNLEIIELPLADGGEGSAEIIKSHLFNNVVYTSSHDPLNRKIKVKFYTDSTYRKAFVESAEIIGLPLLRIEERNPLEATTYGLGEVIKDIIEMGIKEIIISLGGSATCDGGMGMMEALKGCDIRNINFKILCDVTNPLLGDNGAVNVFAPQKGAKPEDLPLLEKRLVDMATEIKKQGICTDADLSKEGSGAAGGLGFAFQTILKAETFKGIEYILDMVNFKDKINGADLMITGEGKIDKQSLMGKVISGVLNEAKKKKIPVVALGGIIENKEELYKAGLKDLYEISDHSFSITENMKEDKTIKNIKKAIKEMLKNNIFEQFKYKLQGFD